MPWYPLSHVQYATLGNNVVVVVAAVATTTAWWHCNNPTITILMEGNETTTQQLWSKMLHLFCDFSIGSPQMKLQGRLFQVV